MGSFSDEGIVIKCHCGKSFSSVGDIETVVNHWNKIQDMERQTIKDMTE